jgi:hypothetical protein
MPILHRFNGQQFPQESRETMDVSEAFPEPMSLLWKSKYDRFNPCQTAVSEVLCTTDDNILISAPTGAGKTGTVYKILIFLTLGLSFFFSPLSLSHKLSLVPLFENSLIRNGNVSIHQYRYFSPAAESNDAEPKLSDQKSIKGPEDRLCRSDEGPL